MTWLQHLTMALVPIVIIVVCIFTIAGIWGLWIKSNQEELDELAHGGLKGLVECLWHGKEKC